MAMEGDYIIKVGHREFYPCKPDIFVKTYTQVFPKSVSSTTNGCI